MNTNDNTTTSTYTLNLGAVEDCVIQSTVGPFHWLPNYRIIYPPTVIQALAELFLEYNTAFGSLIDANREWSTDYECAFVDGVPQNFAIQIDMTGLNKATLARLAEMPVDLVREKLRHEVFEFENSLAMYQLLERIFTRNGRPSFFSPRYRASLEEIRKRTGRPVALLAVTQQKYVAMLESEFGKQEGEALTDEEVRNLSGFDRFFGPDQFKEYIRLMHGKCDFLLFVRSSDPVSKLKKPDTAVEHPLLGDPEIRRVIKANAITFNIDSPDQPLGGRINDTKEYMPTMDMAFRIEADIDMFTREFSVYLASGKPFVEYAGERLSQAFSDYLRSAGVDPDDVAYGRRGLRFKPAKGTYGCYGHVTGLLTDNRMRIDLRGNMRKRGAYVVQPELDNPRIVNECDGTEYTYIDRNFFGYVGGKPMFLGGFRSLMPVESAEAKAGRVHGNGDTVWAEIISE